MPQYVTCLLMAQNFAEEDTRDIETGMKKWGSGAVVGDYWGERLSFSGSTSTSVDLCYAAGTSTLTADEVINKWTTL